MPPADPHETVDLQHNPTLDPRVARSLLRYEIQLMCRNTTHAEMGKRLGVSRASFTQLLAGKNLPSQPTLEVLATHFEQRSRLPRLIRLLNQAKKRPTGSAPVTQIQNGELAIGLYQTAKTITAFDTYLVNPTLRTPAYSSALHAYPVQLNEASTLTWYVEEHVLQRQVGDAETMHQQHQHLATLTDNPRITIRILPPQIPSTPSPMGGFTLFETGYHQIIYEETSSIAIYHDLPEILARYREYIDGQSKMTIDSIQSRAIIARLAANS